MVCRSQPQRQRTWKVLANQSLTQEYKDKGATYSGKLGIGGVSFEYLILISLGVNVEDEGELRRLYDLAVGSEQEVKQARECFDFLMKKFVLSNEEYAFFASVIIPFMEGFISRREVKATKALKKRARKKGIGTSGIQTVGGNPYWMTITEEEIELLKSSFGCKFD